MRGEEKKHPGKIIFDLCNFILCNFFQEDTCLVVVLKDK
jgi:hypothetical protein